AEAGHLIVAPNGRRCACGQRGCLEAYASAGAVARQGIEAVQAGERTILAQIYAQNGERLSAKDVFTAAYQGDGIAANIIEEATAVLGVAWVGLRRLLDPQRVVFAGGLILAGENLFAGVRASFAEHDWTILRSKVAIVPAQLGNQAGIIGAAAVAMEGVG